MKKLLLLPLIATLAVVAAGSGGASTQSPAAAGSALIKCGKTRTIGIASPLTGDAASLGLQQLRWTKFFVSRYNRAHKRKKFRLIQGDTQLPNTAQALAVAHQFASNSKILGLVGPAGSCIHLPPLLLHSLENSGTSPMRVVAVFHPAGDPASRAYEANE